MSYAVVYVLSLLCCVVCSLQSGKGLSSWLSYVLFFVCVSSFPNVCLGSGLEVIKLFTCSTQLSTKYFLLINVKMPTIVGKVNLTFITRTHSMARHGKSPCSRRNLMKIDPLTPYQGHQFYQRLKLFSVSWSTAHPLYFDMPHDHVQKIKFLTPPKGPRGVVTQIIVPVHVPFMLVTHTPNLFEFRKKKI